MNLVFSLMSVARRGPAGIALAALTLLGPIALGAIAVVLLGLGYVLQVKQNTFEAGKAAALLAGPPLVVAIAEYDRDRDRNGALESVVQAQAAFDYSYDLWFEDSPDYVVMVPLLAADAMNETDVLGVAYFEVTDELTEAAVDAAMDASFVRYAEFGPVLNLSGRIKGMEGWGSQTKDAFADEGLVMPDNPVVIWPYMEGRDAALAPRREGTMSIFGLISKVAGFIGLVALFKLCVRRKDEDPEPVEFDESVRPAVMMANEGALQRPLVPQDDLIAPRKTRFGLRKVLIGVIASGFILMLGSVIWGLVQESRPATAQVNVLTAQELTAAVIADEVVPDADPNRHWTDIDVAPLAEWAVAKFYLALAGDRDAQIIVGIMALAPIVLMFMLRWFFVIRRSLRPRTTARFDSMGLN